MTPTIDAVDALLPQTQCRECGYSGCRPYATAIIEENAPINLCPPGGLLVLQQLGQLLKQDYTPYLDTFIARTPSTLRIVEADCIGCTKCIQACPVDAIIGAAKSMHTILEAECTGCGLCVAPCPVDCIITEELPTPKFNPAKARTRFHARNLRLLQLKQAKKIKAPPLKLEDEQDRKRAYIRDAIARSQAKKGTS